MINIITVKGETYSFDEVQGHIYKDGRVLPSTVAEPLFTRLGDEDVEPRFSGLLLKETNSVLSLSGKISPIVDTNTLM